MAVQALRRFVPPPASDFAPLCPRRTFVLTGMAILAAAGYYEVYRVLQSAAKAPSSNLTNLMDALRGQSPR